ncbi:hypothetical protein LOC68_14305 [Blastopirellula sp. JC732]|uniref:Tetratricopeptide repeat protein n=1 Tax=Blastopirellula sediminis TaxID=2894196 RepID=A0A9X1SH07_9BACT|nr:hypothetical protein [Blastopirellula sediminis]MCC9607145.1 hypothetical protein [Blastopirellula sediminis]MCC9629562.1 hypothetical protein [Blastopirellula sediminis]
MSIDPYSNSPCGTDKKIKFYCPEMIPDLEKIERMVAGDQRVAALDVVQKLLDRYPDHSVPLFYRAVLQMQVGTEEKIAAAIGEFLAKHPQNPAAHALNASFLAAGGQPNEAVEELQTALELSPQQLHFTVYEALGAVGQALLMDSKIPAARAHLMLQSSIAPEDDDMAMQLLMRINSSRELPSLLKTDPTLAECPSDFPKKDEFEAALVEAGGGRWRKAISLFEQLKSAAPRNVALLENLAVLSATLGYNEAAIGYLHSYAAAAERSDFESAVEAESLAQLLSDEPGPQFDMVNVPFAVQDLEGVLEKLRVDDRASVLPIDVSQLADGDNPPPKVAYWLLDRAVPTSAEGLTVDAAPNVLGEMLVFGKETDRDARLELSTMKNDKFDETVATLREVCGDTIGAAGEEKKLGEIPKAESSLTWSWRLPDSVTAAQKQALTHERRRQALLDSWTAQPQPALDGKTALDAIGDAALRVKLAAAVLVLENAGQAQQWKFDFNELRQKLQLPTLEKLDATQVDVDSLPSVRLYRIDPATLDDTGLVKAYGRSVISAERAAIRIFAEALLGRESLAAQIDKGELYGQLARNSGDSDKAIEYLKKAQAAAVADGQSPGMWKLAELGLRLERREPQESQALLNDLTRNHMQEAEVARPLMQLLYQFGIIGPDGRPTNMPPGGAPAPAAAQPAAGGGLWTPDNPTGAAAPAGEAQKSKLWMPGMD